MESPHQILATGEVDARLPAHARVHHRQKGRRHLDERNAAQIRRGHEARQVADHAPAERHQHRLTVRSEVEERLVELRHLPQVLAGIAVRHLDPPAAQPRRPHRAQESPGVATPNRGHGQHHGPPSAAAPLDLFPQAAQRAGSDLHRIGALPESDLYGPEHASLARGTHEAAPLARRRTTVSTISWTPPASVSTTTPADS